MAEKEKGRRLVAHYDYRCQVCNIETTVERSMFEEGPDPICCGMGMRRIFGSPPVKFNGSGFYTTDNPKR
jgi:hypothetical protein